MKLDAEPLPTEKLETDLIKVVIDQAWVQEMQGTIPNGKRKMRDYFKRL